MINQVNLATKVIFIIAALGTLFFLWLLFIQKEKNQNPPEKIEQYGQTYVLQTEAPPATTEINGHTYVLQE